MMDVELIHLTTDDDLMTIREKISWSKTELILLHYPPGVDKPNREVDLLLLARFSASLGKTMGIVARQESVVHAAKKSGIVCFADAGSVRPIRLVRSRNQQAEGEMRGRRTLRQAELLRREVKQKPESNQISTRTWLGLLMSAFVLLAAIALGLFLPRAEAILTANTATLMEEVELVVNPALLAANDNREVPARRFTWLSVGDSANALSEAGLHVPKDFLMLPGSLRLADPDQPSEYASITSQSAGGQWVAEVLAVDPGEVKQALRAGMAQFSSDQPQITVQDIQILEPGEGEDYRLKVIYLVGEPLPSGLEDLRSQLTNLDPDQAKQVLAQALEGKYQVEWIQFPPGWPKTPLLARNIQVRIE